MFWMITASSSQSCPISPQQTTPAHTILRPIRHPQALSPQHALGPHADNALVGSDIDTRNARLVVGHADARRARASVSICAPRRVIDCVLAAISGALVGRRAAASFSCCAFATFEVEPMTRQCLVSPTRRTEEHSFQPSKDCGHVWLQSVV